MPTTRIEIESIQGRWVAEVELTGISAKRHLLRSGDFDDLLRQISAAFHEHEGTHDPLGPRVTSDHWTEEETASHNAEIAAALAAQRDADFPFGPGDQFTDEQVAQMNANNGERPVLVINRIGAVDLTDRRQVDTLNEAPWGRKADGTPKRRPGKRPQREGVLA